MPQKPKKPGKRTTLGGDFDKALSRLVNVPKAEVDKEEAKWRRMQQRAAERRKAKGKKSR
jgi:hypothetical protein